MFRFIHSADIHLDSPLKGLERYEGAPVDELRGATRRALENLVALAIESDVDFVLIAGDLYDGDWKDYNTPLYFASQMRRLQDASIPVYLIAGNHDAANKMTRSLRLPANVHMFSHDAPETALIESLGVAIHGQSFASAEVSADLSAAYPTARKDFFNIGLLHTSATGYAQHARYAPCSIEGLRSKEYDYWALGHIHQQEILHAMRPMVAFAGNVQGRHIRETGPKGCLLVTVDDRGQPSVERKSLDVLRWELCRVDASGLEHPDDVLAAFTQSLAGLRRRHGELPLAVRVEVHGASPIHERLAADPRKWTNHLRAAAIEAEGRDVWLEKVLLHTTAPSLCEPLAGDGPLGELLDYLEHLQSDDDALARLAETLADLRRKLPAELADRVLGTERPQAASEILPLRHTTAADHTTVSAANRLREILSEVEPLLVGRLSAGSPTAPVAPLSPSESAPAPART